jgi:Protein of unknown function (DUF3168)
MATVSEIIHQTLQGLADGGAWQEVNTAAEPVYPYIAWTFVVAVENNSMSDGPTALQPYRIQVDVYGRTIVDRDSVALAATAALTAHADLACIRVARRDLYEEPIRAFRRSMDFSLWSDAIE